MQTVAVPIIETESDFAEGCDRLAQIMGAEPGTRDAFEAEALAAILDAYQKSRHVALPDASPPDVVKFVLEDRGLDANDLLPIFGSASRVSSFLSGRRELTKLQIRQLHEIYGIPYGCLI